MLDTIFIITINLRTETGQDYPILS